MRRRNPRRSPRGAARPTPAEQPTSWYRIENFIDRPDTAAIYIYEEIGYWGVEAADFVRDLQSVAGLNLEVHINSPGGDVFDGLAIFNALKQHAERAQVTVRIDGLAASAASFIAQAGDIVKISRNAQMMIHDASGMCWGNATDMQTMADLLNKCSDNIADIYAVKAGGTVEAWRAAMKAETWYTGLEAVAAGLADEIDGAAAEPVEPGEEEDPEEPLAAARWDLSIFTYAGREKAPAPSLPVATADALEAPEAPAVLPGPAEEGEVAAPAVEGAPATADAATDTPEEPVEEREDLPADIAPASEPDETPDEWAAATARLLETPADDWTALTGGLLTAPAQPAWADLTEALL